MSNFEFEVNPKDFLEYLNKLEELSKDTANKEVFLRDASYELHYEYIAPLIPLWNPNLSLSPLESDHQIFESTGSKSTLELLYTGFTKRALARKLPKGVWSEFGDKEKNKLERDYALYQETGHDPYAEDFEGHHYAQFGTKAYTEKFNQRTMEYLEKLIHLERWTRVNPPL